MKRCPTCQRTYAEDSPDYCPNDGMRLVRETPAGQEPERAVLSSGLRVPEPVLPEPARPQPPATEPSAPGPPPPSPVTPYVADEPASFRPVAEQPPPAAPNFAPQGWAPPPQPQAAQPWPAQPYQAPPPALTTPLAPQYAVGGRSRALAVAALVAGCCAVTIMLMIAFRSLDFVLGAMLTLGILGIVLSVVALLLSLQKPARFGGIPLAIAGLATGTAALVYYFTL